jgi:hypothetical protein
MTESNLDNWIQALKAGKLESIGTALFSKYVDLDRLSVPML